MAQRDDYPHGREGSPDRRRAALVAVCSASGLASAVLFFLTAAISFRRPGTLAALFSDSQTWRFFVVPLAALFFVGLGCLFVALFEVLAPRVQAAEGPPRTRRLEYLCVAVIIAILASSAVYVTALHLKTKVTRYENVVIINIDPYEEDVSPYYRFYAFTLLLLFPLYAVFLVTYIRRSLRGLSPG